jgi:hypothetical protein
VALGRPARAGIVVGVVVVGLGAGLVVADLTTAPRGDEDAGPVPTSSRVEPPGTASTTSTTTGTTAPTTTRSTTSSPLSTTTSGVPTTTVVTTVPTTLPPTTAPPTTTPALITVSYLQDPTGALVVPAGGSGTITLVNTGGAPGQWLLRASAGDLVLSATQGTLAPGEQVTVVVTDPVGEPRRTEVGGFVAPSQRVAVPVVVSQ